MRSLKAFVFVTLIAMPLAAQRQNFEKSAALMREAAAAHEAKEFGSYLAKVQEADKLRPGHPRLLYNLAGALALNGKKSEALATLGRVAAMGMVFPLEDPDFAAIRESEEFRRIGEKFAANAKPVNRSSRAFTFPGKGLITEGVAFDRLSGDFFVSSVRERRVVRIDKEKKATPFADREDGLFAAMGMAVDQKRRLLWIATSALPEMDGANAADEGKAGAVAVNIDNGKVVQKAFLDNKPERHVFGDLTVDDSGVVYLSDSLTPAIYRLRPNSSKLELLVGSDAFVSPQGLALGAEEKKLYVADYALGILAVDLKSRQVTAVPGPDDATLLGIDGLYFYENTLIGVQNGTRPARVIRMTLDKERRKITAVETLEANHADFDEPTLGVAARGHFWFVANSQWGAFDEKKNLVEEKLKDPVVLVIDL